MGQGYLAIIASMLIWGSVGIFARKAGQDPLITVTYRVLFGGGALALLELVRLMMHRGQGAIPSGWKQWGLLLFSGAALAINWLFYFKAVAVTSVSNAVLSYYMAPVLVAIASPVLFREPLERRTMAGTGLSVLGLFVMLYQPGQSLTRADLAGIGYGLVAACFYAMVTVTGRWLERIPATRLVLAQCTVAAAALVPAALLSAGPAGDSGLTALAVSPRALALLALVGVIHTALALYLYFQGLRQVKVQHVGVLSYLDPVSAVLFAYLFLGEVPAPASLAGGALILGGSALLLRRSAETQQAA